MVTRETLWQAKLATTRDRRLLGCGFDELEPHWLTNGAWAARVDEPASFSIRTPTWVQTGSVRRILDMCRTSLRVPVRERVDLRLSRYMDFFSHRGRAPDDAGQAVYVDHEGTYTVMDPRIGALFRGLDVVRFRTPAELAEHCQPLGGFDEHGELVLVANPINKQPDMDVRE